MQKRVIVLFKKNLLIYYWMWSSLQIAILIGIFSMWSKFIFWISYAISILFNIPEYHLYELE